MLVDTHNLVSMTEANQNFSRVARLVDERGSAVILRNNVPRYVVLDFRQLQQEDETSDTDVATLSRRAIAEQRQPYEILA